MLLILVNGNIYIYYECVLFLQQYRKLSQSYYPLLECLTQDHMSFITSLEPRVFFYILTSISEGLTAVGKNDLHSAKERIQVFRIFKEAHSFVFWKINIKWQWKMLGFEHFKNVLISGNGAKLF